MFLLQTVIVEVEATGEAEETSEAGGGIGEAEGGSEEEGGMGGTETETTGDQCVEGELCAIVPF